MFQSISSMFSMLNNLFKAGDTIARTGVKYAEQFEAEADLALVGKRAQLKEQQDLLKA